MSKKKSAYLIKQRAFLKVFLLAEIEKGQSYGLQLKKIIRHKFEAYGFEPDHSEIYRSLKELTRDGYLKKTEELVEGADLKTVEVYRIKDKDKVKAYKELVKPDLDRSRDLLRKAIDEIYS